MASGNKKSEKVECLNPNTGGRMNIDKEIYDLFVKSIKATLKGSSPLTFTEMVEGITNYISKQKIHFDKSIGWYAVTIKNDMEARKMITTYSEKGQKLHRLS